MSILKIHTRAGAKALLWSGVSTLALSQVFARSESDLERQDAPTPERSGAALIGQTAFSDVEDHHLAAPLIVLPDATASEGAMRQRIEWMLHAGSASSDVERATRAHEAIDVITGQLAPRGEFDPELLAENIALLAIEYAAIISSLFIGHLDDVPDLIDQVTDHVDVQSLVQATAWMFVCWAAFEQQREACLGWRLRHVRLDGLLATEGKRWTIAQTFGPRFEEYKLALKFQKLHQDNLRNGVDRIGDKRTINSLEKWLTKIGKPELRAANEQETISRFGISRVPTLTRHLDFYRESAEWYHNRYERMLVGEDGQHRGGQFADMLAARISTVHRTAIVCARTFHIASLAARATTTDDLRKMLNTRLPPVLRPSKDTKPRPDKFRLRQLFHVTRLEFLRDGEHLPKCLKGSVGADYSLLPLDLSPADSRRGHEIFDKCWTELRNQPGDWQFITSFGWQCNAPSVVRDTALARKMTGSRT